MNRRMTTMTDNRPTAAFHRFHPTTKPSLKNSDRFWLECKERDSRKQKQRQYYHHKSSHLNREAIVSKLKADSVKLTQQFNAKQWKKPNPQQNNTHNLRHTTFDRPDFTQFPSRRQSVIDSLPQITTEPQKYAHANSRRLSSRISHRSQHNTHSSHSTTRSYANQYKNRQQKKEINREERFQKQMDALFSRSQKSTTYDQSSIPQRDYSNKSTNPYSNTHMNAYRTATINGSTPKNGYSEVSNAAKPTASNHNNPSAHRRPTHRHTTFVNPTINTNNSNANGYADQYAFGRNMRRDIIDDTDEKSDLSSQSQSTKAENIKPQSTANIRSKSTAPHRQQYAQSGCFRSKSKKESQNSNASSNTQFEELTLRKRLEARWEELKRDVDRTFKNFQRRRMSDDYSTQPPFSETQKTEQKPTVTKPSKPKFTSFINQINESKLTESEYNTNETKDEYKPTQYSDTNTNPFENNEISDDLDGDCKEESIPIPQSKRSKQTNDVTFDSRSRRSSIYSNVTQTCDIGKLSVRELKERLISMNVNTEKCIEKKDLIEKLKQTLSNENNKPASSQSRMRQRPKYHRYTTKAAAADAQRYKPKPNPTPQTPTVTPTTTQPQKPTTHPRQPTMPSAQPRKSTVTTSAVKPSAAKKETTSQLNQSQNTVLSEEMIRQNVDIWIERWSHKKSLRQLLNSLLEHKNGTFDYLYRGADVTRITKAYRKAILKIHPDRHVNDEFEVRYKTSEQFKIVTALFEKYKKKRNIR